MSRHYEAPTEERPALLYRADAVEMLRSMPDRSVHAIVTDPPYASGGFQEAARRGTAGGSIGRVGTGNETFTIRGDNMTTPGITTLLRLVAVEAARVLVDGGWLLVFLDWRMVAVLQPHLESAGLGARSLICWAKPHAGMGNGFRSQTEYVLALALGKPNVHCVKYGNVFHVKRTRNEHHPTEKPLDLMGKMLEVTTTGGDIVVDPFCGSGTTGVAAVGMGRRFVGADIDPEHLHTSGKRLADLCEVGSPFEVAPSQPSLFLGVS